jgi:retinal rod rhodopsin-sensitive cGMP 3',5'-cyclic phosphodiesterase subunit delta
MESLTIAQQMATAEQLNAVDNEAFRLVSMQMHDGETGKVMWDSREDNHWRADTIFSDEEQEAHIPASILKCRAVARTIEFYSRDLLNDFSLSQHVYLGEDLIEAWDFHFGFVIPGTTNSWQNTIDADTDDMIPADLLSGNLVIHTRFLDGDRVISASKVRIFYDQSR